MGSETRMHFRALEILEEIEEEDKKSLSMIRGITQ